jgi:2-polyprenyl-6-methoxyphenol hydroxylase-like FAD-dependent oxidoreductase
MQFHLNGYRSGDPAISAPLEDTASKREVDVLIVGCGPAGLTLAAQLSAFPEIRTRIVERKPGPLEVGQADGIACRSMEMFEAFGFAEKVMKESCWINETTFWRPDPASGEGIARSHRIQDVEDGLSEFPHVVLNQARVHDFYLEVMRNGARRLEPDYNLQLVDLQVDDRAEAGDHPVTVTLQRSEVGREAETETVAARYVVGCDGARSSVRKALGVTLRGDSANKVWGVMDVLAVTDFPDIRMKCAIQSPRDGSILVIPREGGYLVRMYIELDALAPDERVADRHITSGQLVAAAQRILHPYKLDVKEVAWWSAYEIGQRVADSFDDVHAEARGRRQPRVFIAGDACHTHSPKAGQGMNVSMADAFNLGWKLAAVLRGQAAPSLLDTYSAERQAKARELIDFDRDMAKLFAARPKADGEHADPAKFAQYFSQHGRYTAGVETRYDSSTLVGGGEHQSLATGFEVGKRLHSAPVVRLADAKPMQLTHAVKADGRWRLFLFAGQASLEPVCEFLANAPESPVLRHTPPGADLDSVIDVRAVYPNAFRELDLSQLPALLKPSKGRHGLTDYEKIFCADAHPGQDIYALRGVDRVHGCMVLVRPDQFVAAVLPLSTTAHLGTFLGRVLTPQR